MKRKFQYTDLKGNSNKFWQFDYDQNNQQATFTWGRVGDTGQSKTMGMGAYQLENKVAEKIKKGYVEVDLGSATAVAAPAPSHQFAQWIGLAASQSISSFYNGDLNTLSLDQVRRGRAALRDVWNSQHDRNDLLLAVQNYYRIIPTQLPRRIDPSALCSSIIDNFAAQEDRLNQLEASLTSAVQTTASALPFEIRDVQTSENLYDEIHRWVLDTDTHSIRPKVKAIYEIKLAHERERFEAETFGGHNTNSFFHGTNTGVMQYICTQGLRVPDYAANGSMFGRGIYLADKSGKSMQYCRSGGNVPKMLLICDAKVGDSYIPDTDCPHFKSAPAGYQSVLGKQGHTQGFNGPLRFNEFIVYRPSQVTIRAVVCFN